MPREPTDPANPDQPEPEDDREKALLERETRLKARELELQAQIKRASDIVAELDAQKKPAAHPPQAGTGPLAEGLPPPRPRDDPRWKHIPPEERVVIEPNTSMASDAEYYFSIGLPPSEVAERMGLPNNRFTHDQLRKYYLRQRNLAPQGARGATGDLADAGQILETLKPFREAGWVFTRRDLDDAIDKAIGRAGGPSREDDELRGLDGPSRSNVLMAREVRALGTEVIDTVRQVTGHPKIGKSITDELREQRDRERAGGRVLPTRHVPELPPGGTRSEQPIAPAPQAPQPTAAPPQQGRITDEHPEFWPALDRIVELAPRIYEFVYQREQGLPPNAVIDNVQADASLAAIAAWRLASKTKAAHEFGRDERCVRCGVAKAAETVGRSCEKGLSQRDMLRRLHGMRAKDIIELVDRYQGAVEVNTPLDVLGGFTVRDFLLKKKWPPGERMNLGGQTIYGVVLQTDEGLTWLGTFLGRLTEEIDKPETSLFGREALPPDTKTEGKKKAPQAPTGPPVEGKQTTPTGFPQDNFERNESGGIVVRRTVDMPLEQERGETSEGG